MDILILTIAAVAQLLYTGFAPEIGIKIPITWRGTILALIHVMLAFGGIICPAIILVEQYF